MEKEFDSIGVIYESQTINDHTILNPISMARCCSIDEMNYNIEFLGKIGSAFEGNFEDEHISIGFVTKFDELIKKYGSLEEGIARLQNELYPYILVQTSDDVEDIIKTFKVDLFAGEVYKVAEYNLEEDSLNMESEQVDITDVKYFNNLTKKILEKKEKDNNDNENSININMLELDEAIKENIIGQDNTIENVISTIDRNYNIENYRNKTNILLIGPPGSGKSEMFRTISEKINVPITFEDSEQYSATGYQGCSVDEMLVNLYNKANGDLEAAEHGIIVIDEIDKKVTNQKGDVSGDRVLNALLAMMEGSTYRINIGNETHPEYIMFDTSYVTFVLVGAFAELSVKQKGMGINNKLEDNKKYKDITIDDLNKYGFPSQTLRRLSIFRLNELTVDDFVSIMKYSKNSVLLEYTKYAKKKGIKLYINDKAIKKIAEISLKKNIGVSGIKDTLNELLNKAFFEVGTHPDQYSSIKLTEESIDKKPPYTLYKKRKKK